MKEGYEPVSQKDVLSTDLEAVAVSKPSVQVKQCVQSRRFSLFLSSLLCGLVIGAVLFWAGHPFGPLSHSHSHHSGMKKQKLGAGMLFT